MKIIKSVNFIHPTLCAQMMQNLVRDDVWLWARECEFTFKNFIDLVDEAVPHLCKPTMCHYVLCIALFVATEECFPHLYWQYQHTFYDGPRGTSWLPRSCMNRSKIKWMYKSRTFQSLATVQKMLTVHAATSSCAAFVHLCTSKSIKDWSLTKILIHGILLMPDTTFTAVEKWEEISERWDYILACPSTDSSWSTHNDELQNQDPTTFIVEVAWTSAKVIA